VPRTVLRDYQAEAVDAVERAHADGVTAPAVVWATGLGKTELFSAVAERFHRRTARRVVVLAHRRKLARQAAERMRGSAADGLRIGVVMGAQNQTLADVVCASPQTLATESRRRQLLNVGLVIADECHHYAAPSFRKVLDHFTEQGALLLGVTATMSRGDGRALGALWRVLGDQVRDIAFGVTNKHLIQPRGVRVRVDDFDLRTVKRNRITGEYDVHEEGAALSGSMAPKRIAEAITEHAAGRKTVVFVPDVASAEVVAEACREAGLLAEAVHYKVPEARRDALIDRHEDEGDPLQVLVNPMILTEGWDNRHCGVVVVARRTQSNRLYIQMAGRVLRPAPGKTEALIVDVCGASERCNLQAQIDLFGVDEEEPDEPAPCDCAGGFVCICRRGRCSADCACGGGRDCGCVWAEVTELEAGEQDDEIYVDGRLVVEEVDLFHRSRDAWMITYGGTHFLTAGREHFIAITPGEVRHTWDVVRMHKTSPGAASFIARGIGDVGWAQAQAERSVTPEERYFSHRDTGWRARPASAAQLRLAAGYGLEVPPRAHGGEVSAMIDIYTASWRMDAVVAQKRAAQRG
jgi:superfamily II DNA or RNA helicase